MNNEYILKMLAVLEHDKIKSAINKKGYLVSVKKLSNYDEYEYNIDSLLKDNYETISNNISNLSDKAITFLENPKMLEHLIVNDIISYSIIKIDINYIINKILIGFKYEIIEDKVELSKYFNSKNDAINYIASLDDKKDTIKSLFKQFNLKYILVFNISSENFSEQIVIDTNSNKSIGLYAINHCIEDDLLDFDNDTLIVGVKAIDNWKLKRTAIIQSEKFILNNAYPNFSNIKVKLCAPDGSFLDELGECLISMGYKITGYYKTDKCNEPNKTNTMKSEKIDIAVKKFDVIKKTDEDVYKDYIKELDKTFESYLKHKLSPKVYIDCNLKKNIIEPNLTEKNKIKHDIKNEIIQFKKSIDEIKDLSSKINKIKIKINELNEEIIPF